MPYWEHRYHPRGILGFGMAANGDIYADRNGTKFIAAKQSRQHLREC